MSRAAYISSNFDGLFKVWFRRTCLFGALMFMVLTFLDHVAAPEHATTFLGYRITASLMLIGIYFLAKRLNDISLLYLAAYVAVALSAVTIELMILTLGGHRSPYYVGMILLAICAVTLIPARPRFHMGSLILIYLIYVLPILIGERITDFPAFFMANSFIVTCFSAAFVPSFFIARHLRKNYGLQYDLELERKRTEKQLSENLPGIVYRLHLSGEKGMQFFNEMLEPITGYRDDELDKGLVCYIDSLIVPQDRDNVVNMVRQAVSEAIPFEVEYRIMHKNGGVRFCLERGRPVAEADGKVSHIDGIILDITDRKQAEMALRDSEERYRRLVESEPDVVLLFDAETLRIEDVNPAASELFGYTREEFLSMTTIDLSAEKELTMKNMVKIKNPDVTKMEVKQRKHIRKDGTIFYGDIRVATFYAVGRKKVIGSMRDVTERKQAEEALRESEEKYRQLFESESDAVMMFDADTLRMEDANSATLELFGYTKEEFLGLTPIDISREKESTIKNMEAFKREDSNKMFVSQRRFIKKDGTEFYGDISGATFHSMGRKKVIGAVRDVTVRIRAEKERKELEHMYHQAQKLEALGELSSGISHDFNNILAIILNNLELARMQGFQSITGYIDKALDAVERGKGLVGNLVNFSRGMVVEPDVVSLGEITEGTVNFMKKASDDHINVDVSSTPGLWSVYGNPSQLQQVVMNLYQNARDATKDLSGGGEPYIAFKLDNVVIPRTQSGGGFSASEEEFVRLRIEDNGSGMDDNTKARIFEPFFSTKGAPSRGVGLSAVYGIVKRNGGWIDVESNLGSGTSFSVYIPRYSGQRVAAGQLVNERIAGGSETVLVVDDEQSLADSAGEMLETLGYSVKVAYSGEEALDVFKERSGEIDLLLVDMVMPGMSGAELLEKIRQIDPDARIIMASGNMDEGAHKNISNVAYLQKPYSLGALSQIVRKTLGTESGSGGMKRHMQRVKLYSVKEDTVPHHENITSAKAIYKLFKHIAHDSREKFVAVFLDSKKRIIAYDELTQGTFNEVVVHSQEVMRSALLTNAAGIILVHNHPSGDVEPSAHDIELTSRMVDSCKMFNIEFLDHIIIGKDGYFSFSKEESSRS